MFCVSMVVALLNYAFQFAAGRILNAADYGSMYSLLSAANISLTIGLIAQTAIAKNIATGSCTKQEAKRYFITHSIIQAVVSVFTAFILLLLKYDIADSIVIMLYVLANNVSLFSAGIAQGYKKFGVVAIQLLIPSFFRLAAIVLMIIGCPYIWAFVMLVVAGIVSLIIGLAAIRNLDYKTQPTGFCMGVLKTLISSVIPMGTLAAFTYMHNVVAKSVASEEEAGAYCLAALLGVAMISIPGSLTPVLVPYAAEDGNKGILVKALAFSEGLACAGGLFFYVLRTPLLRLMFKESGEAAAKYVLPIFTMFVPLVAFHVFVYYLVSIGRNKVMNITCAAALAAVLAISFTVGDITAITYAYAGVYTVSTIILACVAFINSGQKAHK